MIRHPEDVAYELIGTCKDLDEVLTSEELENREFLLGLDQLATQCQTCNWWCECGECDDDEVCEDCRE